MSLLLFGLTAFGQSYTETQRGVGQADFLLDIGPSGIANQTLIGLDSTQGVLRAWPRSATTGELLAPVSMTGVEGQVVRVADLFGFSNLEFLVPEPALARCRIFSLGQMLIPGPIVVSNWTSQLQLSTGLRPRDVCAGDFDGDGDQDIFIADEDPAANGAIHWNQSSFTTLAFTTGQRVLATTDPIETCHAEDIDQDGRPDILLLQWLGPPGPTTAKALRAWRNLGSGSFSLFASYSLGSRDDAVAFRDMNGDGFVDFVRLGRQPGLLQVRINDGTGIFTSSSSATANIPLPFDAGNLTLEDADGDGDADVYLIHPTRSVFGLWMNEGAGALRFHANWRIPGPPAATIAIQPNSGSLVSPPCHIALLNAAEIVRFEGGPALSKLPQPLQISEVWTGEPDWVELTNFGPTGIDLSSWTVSVRTASATFESGPLATTIAPGESLILLENAGSVPGPFRTLRRLPAVAADSLAFRVALRDGDGVTQDEVASADAFGPPSFPGFGTHFDGAVQRDVGDRGIERIFGLDSDGASDWTSADRESPGQESRNSGTRSTATSPTVQVLLNEIDPVFGYIELRSLEGTGVDLAGFSLLISPGIGVPPSRIPIEGPAFIPALGYAVIGDSGAPLEMPVALPGAAIYIPSAVQVPRALDAPFEVALYDRRGRLIDLVRATQVGSDLVHSSPRAPSHWSDFLGAASRRSFAEGFAIGRVDATDRDDGSDWAAIFARSMGSVNTAFAGVPAPQPRFSVRAGGRTTIINAEPGDSAFSRWTLSPLVSAGHRMGFGPLLGLDGSAIQNWIDLQATGFLLSTLDDRGATRFDIILPPGFESDVRWIIQRDAPFGLFIDLSFIQQWDAL